MKNINPITAESVYEKITEIFDKLWLIASSSVPPAKNIVIAYQELNNLHEMLNAITPRQISLFPSFFLKPYDEGSPINQILGHRIKDSVVNNFKEREELKKKIFRSVKTCFENRAIESFDGSMDIFFSIDTSYTKALEIIKEQEKIAEALGRHPETTYQDIPITDDYLAKELAIKLARAAAAELKRQGVSIHTPQTIDKATQTLQKMDTKITASNAAGALIGIYEEEVYARAIDIHIRVARNFSGRVLDLANAGVQNHLRQVKRASALEFFQPA